MKPMIPKDKKIKSTVKGGETFYRRHTVPVTALVNMFLKGYPLEAKTALKDWN